MTVEGRPAQGSGPPVTFSAVRLDSHESWLPREHPLHRPRHGRRQRAALLSAVVFFLVPSLALAMGVGPAEIEGRRLAAFPSPMDGWSFFPDLSDWATDHLPFREAAVQAVGGISRGVFGEPRPFDQSRPAVPAPPFSSPSPVEAAAPPDMVEPPLSAGFPQVIEGKNGWLYYGFDVQGKCQQVRPLDEVIGNLRRLRDAVERSGREFVLVVAPDKSTMVPRNLPDAYVGKSCAAATSEEFWRRVTGEVGAIDLRAELMRIGQRDGGPPYHRLDTHWDNRGAITMVRRVAEQLAPGISAGWTVRPERMVKSPADLPRLIGRGGDNELLLYSLAPDGEGDRARQAVADLRSPLSLRSTAGDGMVTSSVGMLCDSFSLPATRYLPAAFSDVEIVYHSSLSTDRQRVLDVITGHDVVVFEVVERNLASGYAKLVDSTTVDAIAAELAARPRR